MTEIESLAMNLSSLSQVIDGEKYLVLHIDNQLFGIQVEDVGDILSPRKITTIPLAPPEVMGLLNLRGRIVTAINLRVKLNIPPRDNNENAEYRSVIVESKGNLYSLVVDRVSEVISIPGEKIAHNPENLAESWKSISRGVFSLEKDLMIILDVRKLIKEDDDDSEEEVA